MQHILFAALKESRRSGTSFVQSVRSPSLLENTLSMGLSLSLSPSPSASLTLSLTLTPAQP